MNNDVSLAFSALGDRVEADTAQDQPRDRISVRDYLVDVEIGAFQSERGTTQRLCFNVVVEVRPHRAPLSDDVDRVMSYDLITDAIADALAVERINLLETLAERIAGDLLTNPRAVRVFLRIEKLDRGPGALGVEIVRRLPGPGQADTPRTPPEAKAPTAQIVYLSNAAIRHPDLSGWLDRLENGPHASVLCVGPPELPLPRSDAALAQRRIDLLGIEQNAWVLAGRDARCVVTAARTEIDWAIAHRRLTVWAPSKMVLDAVEAPHVRPRDAVSLSAWFATQLKADRFVMLDDTPGPQVDLPPGCDQERLHPDQALHRL